MTYPASYVPHKKAMRRARRKGWSIEKVKGGYRYVSPEGKRSAIYRFRETAELGMIGRYRRSNPMTTEEWFIVGGAAAVVVAIGVAIYYVNEAAENAQEAAGNASDAAQNAADQASEAAAGVQGQLSDVTAAAGNLQTQVAAAQSQAGPITSAAQGIANWWDSL
jgi:hypothetical protein